MVGLRSAPSLGGTAFVVAVMFLLLNGKAVAHSEDEVTKTMLGVADGSISEPDLADWFRKKLVDHDLNMSL